MRNFLLKLSGVAIALTLLIATGCEEDDPMTTNPLGPELSFSSGVGLTSMDAELAPGETFAVELQAFPGDNPLQRFTFLVDGVEPDAGTISNYYNELVINGTTNTANNPLDLFDDLKEGVTIAIEITPFGQMAGDISTYSFEIEDEVGEKASVSLDITVIDPTTPIDSTLTGIFYNVAGQENGSLDLDNGQNVTSEDTEPGVEEAEIRDMGLDCTVPAPGFNWRRQISTVNGADMVAVDDSQLENFTFENVTAKEQIEEAFNTGVTLSDGEVTDCETGGTTSRENVSDELAVGDMFIVLRDGRYYLIRIDDIEETGDNNSDFYEISVKY